MLKTYAQLQPERLFLEQNNLNYSFNIYLIINTRSSWSSGPRAMPIYDLSPIEFDPLKEATEEMMEHCELLGDM